MTFAEQCIAATLWMLASWPVAFIVVGLAVLEQERQKRKR